MNNNTKLENNRKEKTMTTWTGRVALGSLIVLTLALSAHATEKENKTVNVPNVAKDEAQGKDLPTGSTPYSLPFSVQVTKQPCQPESLPGYFGTKTGCNIDFPVCRLVIDGEFSVMYSNAGGNVYRFKGKDFEHTEPQPNGTSHLPVARPYMLGGMWYDDETKVLYAPLHCEGKGLGGAAVSNTILRQVGLASSKDKGLTWTYEGVIVTRDDPKDRSRAPSEYSGLYWDGGAGDFNLFVDKRGGYLYLFMTHFNWPKLEVPSPNCGYYAFNTVARCPISDKMKPGSWQKFYNGDWSQPGLGGKESRVKGCYVMFNSHLGKFISIGWDGSLAVCDDIAKQDWSPRFVIRGQTWKTPNCLGGSTWLVGNEDMIDFTNGGKSLILYHFTFYKLRFGGKYRLDPVPGVTTGEAGFFTGKAGPGIIAAEPTEAYPCEPLAESPDPIIARRTRRVNCQNTEVKYTGVWKDENGANFYEKKAKQSETKNDAIEFHFRGPDVYWRPWKGPDCGLADVFLDGVLQKTVDCWAEVGTPFHYGFIKTGLDTAVVHTIKVVVRGEKNRVSKGAGIRHLAFEYAAESYRATDGFSSIQGQNQWRYQRRAGADYADLAFVNPFWGSSHDDSSGGCQIGYNHMIAGAGDTVRTWTAPRDGTVLIEGAPVLSEGDNRDGVLVSIGKNAESIWSARLEATDNRTAAHNLNTTVRTGGQLRFIIQKPPARAGMPRIEVHHNGSGMPELNACKKKPLKIGRSQKEFSHGLSCVPLSRLVVRLPGPGKTFTAKVGVDLQSVTEKSSKGCVFVVTVGDKVAYQSPAIASQREAEPVSVDLGGTDVFQLDIRNMGGGNKSADWAEATVVLNDGKVIRLADLPVADLRAHIQWDPVVTYETAKRGK